MKRILVGILLGTVMSFGFAGCSEKTQVKEQKTVSTPEGKTTTTTTQETTKSGENPPPAGKEP